MKPGSYVGTILMWTGITYMATESGAWVLDKYVERIVVRGSERSPFDQWVIRTFASPEEREAVDHGPGTKEGAEAFERGANVREITDIYQTLPLATVSNIAPINVWRVCSVESNRVCLLMPPEGSIIFIAEINQPDQKCKTTMNYKAKSMTLAETYINNKALSVYTLRTKTGREMSEVVRNATEFSISYTCEFGPYGTYGFKLDKPLGGSN